MKRSKTRTSTIFLMSLPHSFVEHLIHLEPELEIVRIKSDNCSTQYKSKNIFHKYKQLASDKGIPVICYYGVSSHGKGLVDAMSGFGAKGPLWKAVVTQDLHYDCASNIVSFLKDLFINDDNQKHHFKLEPKEIQSITTSAIKVKDCRIQHKIVFSPDGSIQAKQNICSCTSCIWGALVDCSFELGVQVNSR